MHNLLFTANPIFSQSSLSAPHFFFSELLARASYLALIFMWISSILPQSLPHTVIPKQIKGLTNEWEDTIS